MGPNTQTPPSAEAAKPVPQTMDGMRQALRNRAPKLEQPAQQEIVNKVKSKPAWSLKGRKTSKPKIDKAQVKAAKAKKAEAKKAMREKANKTKPKLEKKLVQKPANLSTPKLEKKPNVKPVKALKQKPLPKPKTVKKTPVQKKAPVHQSAQAPQDRRRTDRRRSDARGLQKQKSSASEIALNKYLRMSYVSLFGLVFVFGGWTATAKIQGAVIASGQVAVDGKPKILQHLEGGIISEIAVKEGDFVTQGQTVVKLDAIILEANLEAAETNYFENQALIARLVSEQRGAERIGWSRELSTQRHNPRVKLAMAGQSQLFEARRDAMSGEIDQLNQRLEQLRGEDSGLVSEIDFTQSELNLVEQEYQRMSDLFRQNLVSRNRVTQLELDATRLKNSVAKLSSRRAGLRSSIEEIQIQISQIGRLREEQILTELRIAQTQADSFSEVLKTVSKKAKLVKIEAPVSGVVHEMTASTIGGVIAPGQEIMQIIPKRDALVINAQVMPQDIDQVHLGQETNVIFSALKQSAAPELSGSVSYISADSLVDPITGSPYFDVEISIADSQLPKLQGQALIPGMPADVFVQTQERTVFDYLTAPLRDTFKKTMRDG